MSYGNQSYGDDVEVTYADERYDLGSKRWLTAGELLNWVGASASGPGSAVFVFNDDSAEITQGMVVVRDGADDGSAQTSAYDGILSIGDNAYPAHRILGVAQGTYTGVDSAGAAATFTTGRYGWVMDKGVGEVLAGTTGITADLGVVCEDANTTDAGKAKVWESDAAGIEEKAVFAFALEAAADDALATCYISIP